MRCPKNNDLRCMSRRKIISSLFWGRIGLHLFPRSLSGRREPSSSVPTFFIGKEGTIFSCNLIHRSISSIPTSELRFNKTDLSHTHHQFIFRFSHLPQYGDKRRHTVGVAMPSRIYLFMFCCLSIQFLVYFIVINSPHIGGNSKIEFLICFTHA